MSPPTVFSFSMIVALPTGVGAAAAGAPAALVLAGPAGAAVLFGAGPVECADGAGVCAAGVAPGPLGVLLESPLAIF